MLDFKAEYLIIGAGIVGLSIASRLKARLPAARIILIEKEEQIATHASGRNSGVLHAGFYYTADSLKARFTMAGNLAWKEFCLKHQLPINACGKLVVAQNQAELEQLYELERRGKANGSQIQIIEEAQASELEPNVRTFKKALYSPSTASIDPQLVCKTLYEELKKSGVEFLLNCKFNSHQKGITETSQGSIEADKVINCAGLYADQIAHRFGFGKAYTIVPFKGLYLKYAKNKTDLKMHIYPVPNLKNPFLGVHFTKTVDGTIKIGPTAIPALWRENYAGLSNFKLSELLQISFFESKLFLSNAFNFRSLAWEEINKYLKSHFINLALQMVKQIDKNGFGEYSKPGIRAQLLHKDSLSLVQDFIVEGDNRSVHILNAVSPGFTCSLPFADYVIDKFVLV